MKKGIGKRKLGRLRLVNYELRDGGLRDLRWRCAAGRSGYWNRDRIEALFPVLGERTRQMGLNLSGGEKKMLSMGRALMANPDLILLDEPSEGLAPMVIANLAVVIGEIQRKGMTILLADQNLKFCRSVCERGYIIEKGRIVHADGMEAIWGNEEVIQKYLVI